MWGEHHTLGARLPRPASSPSKPASWEIPKARASTAKGRGMTVINCIDNGNAVLVETPRFPAPRRAGYDEHTALRPCGVIVALWVRAFAVFRSQSKEGHHRSCGTILDDAPRSVSPPPRRFPQAQIGDQVLRRPRRDSERGGDHPGRD